MDTNATSQRLGQRHDGEDHVQSQLRISRPKWDDEAGKARRLSAIQWLPAGRHPGERLACFQRRRAVFETPQTLPVCNELYHRRPLALPVSMGCDVSDDN